MTQHKGFSLARQTKIFGILFLGLVVLAVYLTYATFTKKFAEYDEVSLETSKIGLQLPERADVKIRGVIVAGCYVTNGKVRRSNHVRVTRAGAMIWEGKIDALKHLKEDVKEIPEGMECGISLDGFDEVKNGDIIESFEIEEIKQKL